MGMTNNQKLNEAMAKIHAQLPTDPGSQPFRDLDPSTTYDPAPNLTAVDNAMTSLAPSGYGGSYQTSDGTIHVGLTSQAPAGIAQQLLAQVPQAPVVTFPAQHAWSELSDIADTLTQEVIANDASPIVTISADPETNTVQVGVQDVNDPAALALKQQYGDAVQIVQQDPYVDLAGTATAPAAAPGAANKNPCYGRAYIDRAKYHQPGYGGLCMYLPTGTRLANGQTVAAPGAICTTGFGMELPGSSPTGDYDTQGFFTAGHCVYDNQPSQVWHQGPALDSFGVFANDSIRSVSHSDGGSLVTNNTSTITYRDSSNLVAVGPGSPPVKITSRMAVNKLREGSSIVISGAISGTVYGRSTSPRQGETVVVKRGGRRYVELHMYKATMTKAMASGDSGAPVYQGPYPENNTGVAVGILSAREQGHPSKVIFSQIEYLESDLGWVTKTS